jgi:hypothetical protein
MQEIDNNPTLIQIHKENIARKTKLNMKKISPFYLLPFSLNRLLIKPNKMKVITSCLDYIEDNLLVENIVKRNIELAYIKKLLFTPGEQYLFNHYPGILNLSDQEKSDSILANITTENETDEEKIAKDLEFKENRDERITNLLQENYKTYYTI